MGPHCKLNHPTYDKKNNLCQLWSGTTRYACDALCCNMKTLQKAQRTQGIKYFDSFNQHI